MKNNHSFDVEDAIQYGVEKAILLFNLRFWLTKNKANKTNIHDGYYWTYNSREAFAELFPYMNPRTIGRYMQELEEQGIVKSGKYNKTAWDRTKWYTIPSEFYVNPPDKMANGEHKNDHCSITDITTDINLKEEKPKNAGVKLAQEILEFWNARNKLSEENKQKEWPNDISVLHQLLPKTKKLTPAIIQVFGRLKGYDVEDFKLAIQQYCYDICMRVPNGGTYHNHRFTMFEFFKQKNGFEKFINK